VGRKTGLKKIRDQIETINKKAQKNKTAGKDKNFP
jgi:hypothetical protein